MLGRALTTDHDNPADVAAQVIAGRYRLLEPLGRGAMSSVWLAEDEELERRVAVKLLAPAPTARASSARLARPRRSRTRTSARSTTTARTTAGATWCSSTCRTARSRSGCERRPLDDDETLRIATEIAAGLAHAHERGLVHRDLKPANVLFDSEDRAKIADFGIARMGDAGTLTEAGTVLGTASYISPEQAGGRPRRPRATSTRSA